VLGITRERLRLVPMAVHSGTTICPCVFQKLEGTENYAGHTEDSFRAARTTSHQPPSAIQAQPGGGIAGRLLLALPVPEGKAAGCRQHQRQGHRSPGW
jgi:hypothetical protein